MSYAEELDRAIARTRADLVMARANRLVTGVALLEADLVGYETLREMERPEPVANVELTRIRAGRYRAVETRTGVDLGLVFATHTGLWMAERLGGGAGLVGLPNLATVEMELERWCREHPGEMARRHRELIDTRVRALREGVDESAPHPQAALPL